MNSVFLKCRYCGKSPAISYHQRTAYFDEESNWVVFCEEHKEENDEFWDDMWYEYYMDRY